MKCLSPLSILNVVYRLPYYNTANIKAVNVKEKQLNVFSSKAIHKMDKGMNKKINNQKLTNWPIYFTTNRR